ncbi:MAG: hypothetical protein A3H76_00970 [Candidatus Lloydbacteria bacterium RIFCSPLOWO2_02_FULL_54_12]|nr:MAG: hypothetical protein A3H76_00970 [Candidatus Lloydbacteria bacterium RIFCSPLOWO2_02_FULL_54_12]
MSVKSPLTMTTPKPIPVNKPKQSFMDMLLDPMLKVTREVLLPDTMIRYGIKGLKKLRKKK